MRWGQIEAKKCVKSYNHVLGNRKYITFKNPYLLYTNFRRKLEVMAISLRLRDQRGSYMRSQQQPQMQPQRYSSLLPSTYEVNSSQCTWPKDQAAEALDKSVELEKLNNIPKN
jgi:hypothetical protein